jgi:hypothetical protein
MSSRSSRWLILFLIIFIGCAGICRADDAPNWTKSHPSEDSFYRYFKGSGEPAPSRAEALALAEHAARRRAAQECFGFELSSSASVFESGATRDFSRSTRVTADRTRIIGFERVEEWISELSRGHLFEAQVLYRYPKQEIEREHLRLKTNPMSANEESWMTAERPDDFHGQRTELRITSEPAGAEVWIDQMRWGTTPLLLVSRIPVGEHQLRLDLPYHDSVSRKFHLTNGQKLPLHANLRRRQSMVQFNAGWDGATVEVVGLHKLKTPHREVRIPEGEEIEVRATHPEAFPLQRRLIVPPQNQTEGPVVISLTLEGRPTPIQIDCQDLELELFLDDSSNGKCRDLQNKPIHRAAGKRVSIRAEKPGHQPEEHSIIPSLKRHNRVSFGYLRPEAPRQQYPIRSAAHPWHLTPFSLDESWHLGLGFGLSGIADTWGVPMWAEYRLLNGLTVGFLYEFCAGPTYQGGGYGPYVKLHLNTNVYRGYFAYAESIQYSGEYPDFGSDQFITPDLPWARSGYGYGLGYEVYPSQSGPQIGVGYRLGVRDWGVTGQEFNANVWTGIRF